MPSPPTACTRRPCPADDRVAARLGGEYEPALLEWVGWRAARPGARARSRCTSGAATSPVPARDLLPPLERYAHLAMGDELRVVGHTDATHGCTERCRHCPVPAVVRRTDAPVAVDLVLDDVAQQVAMRRPARHLRRSRLPGRARPTPAAWSRTPSPAVPRRDLRRHHQGRAHPAPRGAAAGAGRRRLPVRRDGRRAARRRHPRASSTRVTRPPTPPGPSSCCAGTASTRTRPSCRSRRGRARTGCATSCASWPTTTWRRSPSPSSSPCGSCSRRGRCCSTGPSWRPTSPATTGRPARGGGARPTRPSTSSRPTSPAGGGGRAAGGAGRTLRRAVPAGGHRVGRLGTAPAHRALVLLRGADRHPARRRPHLRLSPAVRLPSVASR